jgi:integrase
MSRRGRREGSVYRRADGRWAGVIDLGWQAGRRVRKTVYGTTRRQAADKLATAQRAFAGGLAPAPERLTVGDWLGDWLESTRSTIRPSTFASYESIVRVHLVPSLGRIPLGKLAVADVERLLRAKSATDLSARRVAMIRAVLRRALGRAVKHRLIAANVAALADGPRQERHEIAPLDPGEARRFLAAVKGHRLEAAFVAALMTGLRSGELRALTWDDVSLESRTITVRRSLAWVDGRWERVEPKSRAGRRIVPLPPMAADLLAWHRLAQERDRSLLGSSWRGSEWNLVFTTSVGTPLEPAGLLRQFQAVLSTAGIRRVRFHDLRHSAATFWLAARIPARVVADMLGHSQVSLTLQVYSHVLPELRRDAADRLEAIVTGSPAPTISTLNP